MTELEKTLVVIETMPVQHRGSHRAAGNWGVYPRNGSERRVTELQFAESEVESDPDGYAWIVREADDSDVERYGMAD